MQDLRLGGTADFSQLFDQLDAVEQRLTDLSKVGVVIKPRLDLGTQLKDLDAYAARLKDLGVTPAARAPRAPAQAPAAPTQANAPVGPTSQDVQRAAELKQRLVEIHNTAAILRNDFIAAGTATNVTDEEVAQLQGRIEALQRELRDVRPIAEQTFGVASREVKNLTLTSAQLQRTLAGATGQMSRLGIASQFKLALDQSSLFQNPQGNVNGIVQLVRGYEQARLSSQSFQKTIQRQNQDLATAETFVQKFADRFNVVPSAVEATIKVLLNNGYTLKQAQETLELYGASALVAAKDVNGAVDALASDVQLGTTVMSNQYGITANQATAWQQYAKSIGVAADALTAEQKAEGFLVQLRKEATQDLREADTILAGVGGNLGEASQEYRRAQQALGEALLPAVTNGAKQLTKFLEAFNQLDKPVKDSIANIVVWGTVIAGARIVLSPLIGLLRSGVGVFGKIGELAGKKGAAGAINVLDDAAAAAAPKAAQLGKGLKDISEIGKQPGLWSKIATGARSIIAPIGNAGAVLGKFVQTLAATPATRGGLYAAVLAIGYAATRAQLEIKTLNGLTVGQNFENVALLAGGMSRKEIFAYREEQARLEAWNKVQLEQAEAVKTAREEKDKDLRASKLRTLQLQADLAGEQAALNRAKTLRDPAAALAIQDRIKNLTTSLGLERQNRAVIDANILQQQRLQDIEMKRRPVLDTLKKQQDDLAKQSETIRIEAKSDFAQDIGKIAQDFRAARRKLENQLKNEKDVVIRAEIQTTIDKLDATEQRAILSRTAEQIRGGQSEVAAAQRAVEDARVAAMKDGAAKRKSELDNELKSIRDEYGPKIKEALENATLVKGPDRKAFQQQAGSLQRLQAEAEAIARQNAGRDLERIRKEEKAKADEQVRAAQDAQGRVLQAQAQAAEASAQIIDTQRQRQLDAYGTTADARLRIERQFQQADTAAKTQAARLQASQEAAQLRRTYDDQMKAARDAGAQRGALEASARQEYLTNLSTLERNAADKVAGIQIDAQNRVRDARLAVQQEVLDKELKGIDRATGAELASLRTRLEARRAAALAGGDTKGAAQLTQALKQIETLNTSRAEQLAASIKEAKNSAVELRQKITDAVPKDALAQARSQAASPFNSVIQSAQSQIKKLREDFGGVATPTPQQRAQFEQAVAAQQRVIREANLERNRAVLVAEQATNRQLLEGKRQLARDELVSAIQLAASDQQRVTLRAQLYELDQERLAGIAQELASLNGRKSAEERIKALKEEQRNLQRESVGYTDEEKQRAEEVIQSRLGVRQAAVDAQEALAVTDTQVAEARAERAAMASEELMDVDRRLAKAVLEQQSEEKINTLKAERLQKVARLGQAERAQSELASQFAQRDLAHQQAIARAKVKALGISDDAVANARIELGIAQQDEAYHADRLRRAQQLSLTTEEIQRAEEGVAEAQAQQEDQQRTLGKALEARLKLAQDFEKALGEVNRAAGAQAATPLQAAQRDLDEKTRKLTELRGQVNALVSRAGAGNAITEDDIRLVESYRDGINEQRDAIRALGDEYAKQVTQIDTLGEAVKNLNDALKPKDKNGQVTFDVRREAQEMTRLQKRRDLALQGLESALKTGDADTISQALGKVSELEKAYQEEVSRLKKDGYAPFLNLVDTQKGRVAADAQAAQNILDGLLDRGADNLKAADQLQKDAQAATNDSVPQIAADALARALNTGSERVADQILASLTGGARIVSDSIQRALGAAPPKVAAPATPPVQAGDIINATYTINWQGQELPTPPDYKDMWNKLLPFAQRWAADQGRRNPCPQR